MTVAEIIEQLSTYSRKFPKQAVLEASEYQEEITEILLEHFRKLNVGETSINGGEDMLHMYGLFLLAEFRETRAFPLFIEFLKRKTLDSDIGDTLTEGLDSILYSTYNGDELLVTEFIENNSNNPYARSEALDMYAQVLADDNRWDRLESYVKQLLESVLLQAENEKLADDLFDYIVLVLGTVLGFKLESLLPLVKKLYDLNLVSLFMYGDYNGYERLFKRSEATEIEYTRSAYKEMHWWAAFEQEPRKTIRKEMKKVTKNAPCPCGSGKKYKRCCGMK